MRHRAVVFYAVVTLIGAATVAAEVMGVGSWDEPGATNSFSGSLTWTVLFPVAISALLGLAVWNRARHDDRLARWSLAQAAATALYGLGSSAMVWLPGRGVTGVTLAVSVTIVTAWPLVLATLQASVLAAGESALGHPFGRRGRRMLLGAAAVPLVAGLLFPPTVGDSPAHVDLPSLLPEQLARSEFGQWLVGISIVAWMLSTVALPSVLWVAAARTRGARGRLYMRLAIAAALPILVILLCGVLGAMLLAGDGTDVALSTLAAGFAVAQPATVAWLGLTVQDATVLTRTPTTTLPTMVSAVLWSGYVLAVVQLAAWLGGRWGAHPAFGALAATLVFVATVGLWRRLVRWCADRADPRFAFTAAVRSASANALPAAALAEQAFREALLSPDARLLLRRSARRWTTTDGSPAVPPTDDSGTVDDPAVLSIEDESGVTIGALTHLSRFTDTRSLAVAARPLVERAILEADVQEQAEIALGERRRADAAIDEARRRVERDLHDGVQGRLVSLGLGLSLAGRDSPDPIMRELLGRTVTGIHEVLAELRQLSSGAMSSRLAESGLAAAVGELVKRMPLAVDVDIPELAAPAPIAETAYFVIAEALANSIKHSAAGRVHVVAATAGAELVVRIRDDGIGGVDPRLGTGLRGLQERVHAAGGRLVVSDAPPQGTLVEAVLPCAL